MRAQKAFAMKKRRDWNSRKIHARRSEIDRTYHIFYHNALFDMAWPPDYERNMDPSFVEKLLSPYVRTTVIGEKEDHRTVGKSVLLKSLKNLANESIKDLCRLQIIGPVTPSDRVVRIVGG